MAPQIRLVQNNDTLMTEKIQSTLANTIPGSIIEEVVGTGKWEGRKFFSKAILLDSNPKALFAYKHKRPRWKIYEYSPHVWYNTSKQEDAEKLAAYLSSEFTSTITSRQLACINTMISKGLLTRDNIYKIYNIRSLKELTCKQATAIIKSVLSKQ